MSVEFDKFRLKIKLDERRKLFLQKIVRLRVLLIIVLFAFNFVTIARLKAQLVPSIIAMSVFRLLL